MGHGAEVYDLTTRDGEAWGLAMDNYGRGRAAIEHDEKRREGMQINGQRWNQIGGDGRSEGRGGEATGNDVI